MKFIKVLDILFISETFNKIFELLKKGGLMVVPSGPGLATIGKDIKSKSKVSSKPSKIVKKFLIINDSKRDRYNS